MTADEVIHAFSQFSQYAQEIEVLLVKQEGIFEFWKGEFSPDGKLEFTELSLDDVANLRDGTWGGLVQPTLRLSRTYATEIRDALTRALGDDDL